MLSVECVQRNVFLVMNKQIHRLLVDDIHLFSILPLWSSKHVFTLDFNLFQRIRRNLDTFSIVIDGKLSISTKNIFWRKRNILSLFTILSLKKMQCVAKTSSSHIKFKTCRVLQFFSTEFLLKSLWSEFLIDVQWYTIKRFEFKFGHLSLHFIEYWNYVDLPVKVKSSQVLSWREFMLSILVKRLFFGCFDKSRLVFPSKNTLYMFDSW